jgi:tetratricopeptide (TPR) repeat protein
LIRTYEHLGKGIDFEEVEKMRDELKKAIKELVFDNEKVDSPVYTFLHDLQQPKLSDGSESLARADRSLEAEEDDDPDRIKDEVKFSVLLETAQEATEKGEFEEAKSLFQKCHQLNPADAYIVQQLALATYKSPQDDDTGKVKALIEARDIIYNSLAPSTTNDPETLGLWGAIHKRLWELNEKPADLDTAVWAYGL